jgi:hybrid cluster-associated redox disulfide protein
MVKNKQTKGKITKDMNFVEIFQKNPDAFDVLFKKGMHCVGCGMAASETLEEGAMAHGLDADEIVNEINKETKNKKTKKKVKSKNKKSKVKKTKVKKSIKKPQKRK